MIVRDARKTGRSIRESRENYFAEFDLYDHMAHFVGKTLHIRPGEILDTWGVPELIVAYGQYANEIADENYRGWKAVHAQKGTESTPPKPYIVRFINVRELESGQDEEAGGSNGDILD